MKLLILYLAIVNLFGFLLMGYDKSQARRKGRRVPEKRLFTVAVLGGAVGSWLGMQAFRHKTKHTSFIVGMPSLIVMNAVCLYAFIHRVL